MARFKLFNHRQIFSLVLSTMLVFVLSSSVWAEDDPVGNENGNQQGSDMGTANGDGSVGMTLQNALQKDESHNSGDVPSQNENQQGSDMGTANGDGSGGMTPNKALPKGESDNRGDVHSRNRNRHDSDTGIANGDGSVGMTLQNALQKGDSYNSGDVPSQNANQHGSDMATANGDGSVGMTLQKALQKSESYKKGGVSPQGHVDKRPPQAQERPHQKRDSSGNKDWQHSDREQGRSFGEDRHRPMDGSRHRGLSPDHFGRVGGMPFVYSTSVYFQPDSEEYDEVPPLGARVQILPEGCSSFYYGDRHCYSCGDVFYEEMGADYVVINQPSSYRIIADTGDEVEIDIESLNLRTGPGFRYETLTTLHQGEIVEVDAVDGDWYSVILEDGSQGWIESQYTRIVSVKEDPKG